MSTISRDLTRPVLVAGGLGYLMVLAVALIWLNLSPQTVLILTLGAISLIVLALSPVVALHAFIMLLNIENVVVTPEGLTGMRVVGVVILAGWLLSIAVRRRLRLGMSPFLVVLALFLIWCGVSLVNALDLGPGLVRTFTFLQLATAAVMFSTVVDTPRKLRGVYWGVVLWTCLSTSIAIVEYYLGITRVAVGLAGNRNQLATFVVIAIVCAYLLFQTARGALTRGFLVGVLPLLFLGLALTLSRSGLICLIIALAFVWYRIARERGVVILTASAVVVLLVAASLPDMFWERTSTIIPAIEKQEGTFGIRVRLWKIGLRMIQDHPVVGVGPGNWLVAFPRYARGRILERNLNSHNQYISVASEMGLIGVALFVALNILALREAGLATRLGKKRDLKEMRALAVATEVSILVLMIGGITGDGEAGKLLWLFFGLSLALGRMGRTEEMVRPAVPAALPTSSAA